MDYVNFDPRAFPSNIGYFKQLLNQNGLIATGYVYRALETQCRNFDQIFTSDFVSNYKSSK